MKVKTYRTERGAKAFLARLQANSPGRPYRVAQAVGLDFRDHWYVEVSLNGRWIGVGPLKEKA